MQPEQKGEFLTVDDLIREMEDRDDEFSRLRLEDMRQMRRAMIRALTNPGAGDA